MTKQRKTGKRARKAQTNVVPFISVIESNCRINQGRLIEKAKLCGAFGEVPWEKPSWDVTAAYAHRTRASRGAKSLTLHFTQNGEGEGHARQMGRPMENPFADILKALVRLRHFQKGQGHSNHLTFIAVARSVYAELANKGHDVTGLDSYDLDRAAKRIEQQYAKISSYKMLSMLEYFADLLDSNGLCKLRLKWRYSKKKRPPNNAQPQDTQETAAREDVHDPYGKLPSEDAIRAIASLYLTIQKGLPPDDTKSADRILILIAVLLVCTGFRLQELLSLPAKPVQTARDGSKYLIWYREKASAGNVSIIVEQKTLLTATVDLVTDVVNELLEMTRAQREVAKYIFDHGQVPVSLPNQLLGRNEIAQALEIPRGNMAQYLKNRGIPYEVECIGFRQALHVKPDDLLAGLLRDHWQQPMIPGDGVTRLELHEALCLMFPYQNDASSTTLTYAARPVTRAMVQRFLAGGGKVRSVFERYEIKDKDGNPYQMNTHGPRHLLNHLLDAGGAPDLVQAKWFGRSHEADNKAYQHMTQKQRAEQLREKYLAGEAHGQLANALEYVPVERRKTVLEIRVRAAHDVGIGRCHHDFAMSPCPHHLECSPKCDDFLWIEGDEGQIEELKRQAAVAWLAVETVKEKMAGEDWVESSWLEHNQQKLNNLRAQLKARGLHHIDLAELAAQYVNNAQGDVNDAA